MKVVKWTAGLLGLGVLVREEIRGFVIGIVPQINESNINLIATVLVVVAIAMDNK